MVEFQAQSMKDEGGSSMGPVVSLSSCSHRPMATAGASLREALQLSLQNAASDTLRRCLPIPWAGVLQYLKSKTKNSE